MSNKPKRSREVNTEKVSGYDVCQTPKHALEPIYPLLNKDWLIWESACGPERILETALYEHGYDVIGTDLLIAEKYNFFTYGENFMWDVQITNVPFSLKYLWIQRSFEFHKPFALLVPYETTAAGTFQKIAAKYHNNPWPIEVLAPERRIAFKMPDMGWGKYIIKDGKEIWRDSSAQMPVIWLTWGLNAKIRYPMYIDTYVVPMRNVKYNDDNTEKI